MRVVADQPGLWNPLLSPQSSCFRQDTASELS